MSRADAIAANETTYTGSPCKNCEATLRYVSSGNCVACTKSRAVARGLQRASEPSGGECECCGRDAPALVRDLNHVSGLDRGLICRSCNRVLGLLGDDPATIGKFLVYLTREPLPWD